MQVIYDYQIFALQKMGGISRYFVELARRLPDYADGIKTTVLAPVHINAYLENSPVHTVGRKVASFPGRHHVLPLINRIGGRGFLKKQPPDIFHETYYSGTSQPVHAPRILTVYDMIHERFPDQFHGVDMQIPALKEQAVARADHVIAISKSTRDDLVKYLRVAPEKITVIPLAPSFDTVEERADFEHTDRPYLLYVGLRGGVKNFHRFISAFSRSRLLCSEFDVLCVGGGGFTADEELLLRSLDVREQVRHQQADDSLLAALYARAALFVYPSLYEGFGLLLMCGSLFFSWQQAGIIRDWQNFAGQYRSLLKQAPKNSLILVSKIPGMNFLTRGMVVNPEGLASEPLVLHKGKLHNRILIGTFPERKPYQLVIREGRLALEPFTENNLLHYHCSVTETCRRTGDDVFSVDGSGKRIARFHEHGPNWFAYGVRFWVAPGSYLLRVSLNMEDVSHDFPLTIDVATNEGRDILARQEVVELDGDVVTVPFTVSHTLKVEPRIFYNGTGNVTAGMMEIVQLEQWKRQGLVDASSGDSVDISSLE